MSRLRMALDAGSEAPEPAAKAADDTAQSARVLAPRKPL
jgi:hypothetical protein